MNLANLHIDCCKTRMEWVARIISDIANPLMFPPLLFLAAAWEFNAAAPQLIYVGAVGFTFFTFVPLALLVYLFKTGKIESLDITKQKSRNLPFFYTLMSYIAGALLLYNIDINGTTTLRILLICYILNPIIGWLISQKWKISVHTASVGTSVALFYMLYQVSIGLQDMILGKAALILLVMLIPVVMWSRYHLNIHTIGQVAGGAVIGVGVTYLEIMIMLNIDTLI